MHPAFISVIASAGVFTLFGLLFRIEQNRGRRFAEGVRELLDRGAEWLMTLVHTVLGFIGRDVIRQTAHFIVHQVLRLNLIVVRFVEHRLDWLLRRNKAIAKQAARRSVQGRETKLGQIAEHKVSSALSDEEKKQHKERSIGTKL